jgi:SAM-dependent methyltransferase
MNENKPLDHACVRDFYDRVYHRGSAPPASVSRHLRRLARRLEPWKGKRVLDVGCGTGDWLKAVADNDAIPFGIDISGAALDACRRSLPQAELHCGPAEELPFPDQEFDLISCLGSLEHFLDPDAALREMVRVAKRDALFLMLVPNLDFLPRRLGLYSGTQQAAIREEARSLEGWEELFDSTGLQIERRWKDLHVLTISWIKRGPWYLRPIRAAQAFALPFWPLGWQYQVYYICRLK